MTSFAAAAAVATATMTVADTAAEPHCPLEKNPTFICGIGLYRKHRVAEVEGQPHRLVPDIAQTAVSAGVHVTSSVAYVSNTSAGRCDEGQVRDGWMAIICSDANGT